MTHVLLPPTEAPVPEDAPLIFLAGPIQGAPDWQADAIELIGSAAPEIWIANPRRTYMDGTFVYEDQVDWETAHIRRAMALGTLLFWLAAPVENHPDRAYAQTTRIEIAEAKVRHEWLGGNVVVGIEAGFSGERYIRRRWGQDAPDIPLCKSLEATCEKAVEMARLHVAVSPTDRHKGGASSSGW